MAKMRWPDSAVAVLRKHGRMFARYKPPHGLKTKFRRAIGESVLYGACFRNALLASRDPSGRIWYCEGYASFQLDDGTTKWLPHAWNSPTVYDHNFALDLTWPWYQRGTKYRGEESRYWGLCLPSGVAEDFFTWIRYQGIADPSASILKYADYYEAFLNQMH